MPNVVKHSYIKGSRCGPRASAHLNYIQYRPGEDRETDMQRADRGEDEDYKPRPEREAEDFESRKEAARPLRVAGDEKQPPGKAARDFKDAVLDPDQRGRVVHKFILSPSAKGVDMNNYTQHVMNSIGRQKGQDLQYAWVVHDNTDNRHAHVVVLGKDVEGHQVRFGRTDYAFMRAYGDRYLEREHGIDMRFDKDIEIQARLHGHNLYLSDRDANLRFLDNPYKERSFQADEDFRHLLNINKNWGESLDGPSLEGGLQLGSTWLHDKGRMSEVHDIFQNTSDKDLWTDVKNHTQDQGLKDYADSRLTTLDEERQITINEWQDKLGLNPDNFDGFIKGLQEQFADENRELDQALHPEKYMPQEYEHQDIDTSKIADKDLIHLPNGDILSKYDTADYLNDSRISLKEGPYENRISSEDFSTLCSWIGTKEQHGDHCYGQPPLKDDREPDYDQRLNLDQIPNDRSIESIGLDAALDARALQDLFRPREQELAPADLLVEKLEHEPDIDKPSEREDLEIGPDEIERSTKEDDPYQTNYDIEFDDEPLEIDKEFDLDFNPEKDTDKEHEPEQDEPDRAADDASERNDDAIDEDESICDIDQTGEHDPPLDDDTDRGDERDDTSDRDSDDDEHKRGDRGDR